MNRSLTDEDIRLLAEALKQHSTCALGLNPKIVDVINEWTPEQFGILKHIVLSIGKAANIIGTIVVTAVITVLLGIVSKGFITTFIGWVKNG